MFLNKIKKSLQSINLKLFAALLVMGLCPTIYTTLRVFFLGQLPGDWSYSIAGQLSWVNLIYEIISEAIILPLFFFMGSAILNKEDFSNKLKTGLIVSGRIYKKAYRGCDKLFYLKYYLLFLIINQESFRHMFIANILNWSSKKRKETNMSATRTNNGRKERRRKKR